MSFSLHHHYQIHFQVSTYSSIPSSLCYPPFCIFSAIAFKIISKHFILLKTFNISLAFNHSPKCSFLINFQIIKIPANYLNINESPIQSVVSKRQTLINYALAKSIDNKHGKEHPSEKKNKFSKETIHFHFPFKIYIIPLAQKKHEIFFVSSNRESFFFRANT